MSEPQNRQDGPGEKELEDRGNHIHHHERASSTSSTSETTKHEDQHTTAYTPEDLSPQIETLARQLTRASTTAGAELCALSPQPGSRLDPNSANFDARAWVKAFIKLTESDPDAAPSRGLGVAFRNLDVFGWTNGAEHQKGVLDLPVDVVASVVKMLGLGQKRRRVDILRNFEGVIEQGELLLVLGPPGSGCSTLLKTIAGETAGLDVSDDSYLNFRGP